MHFPPFLIINKGGEENFRPQFISSLENWFSKTLCHRYNAVCVLWSAFILSKGDIFICHSHLKEFFAAFRHSIQFIIGFN